MIEQPPSEETLSPQEIIELASDWKTFGNSAFKGDMLEFGLDKYQKGLKYLN